MAERYLEEFVGPTCGSGRMRAEAERIKSFAAEFGPLPFHLDGQAVRDTVFGRLGASGGHTAALTMHLWAEAAGRIVGVGSDEFRWPRPVRQGDDLHLKSRAVGGGCATPVLTTMAL